MAAAQPYHNEGTENAVPESGKVNKVCRQWLVHEDAVVAHRMQEDEFDYKYGMNRYHRRTVRQDIPVAKEVHTEEEKQAQEERLRQLQEAKRLAEADEVVAKEYMKNMLLDEQRQRAAREMSDQELALKLQEKEKLRYERKARERELARERRRLEQNTQLAEEELMAQYRLENQDGLPDITPPGQAEENDVNYAVENLSIQNGQRQPEKLLRADGKVEDVGDFSDFYVQPVDSMNNDARKELQELQDEELARLLQDQEHKRGAQVNRDKLKAIEAQDQELARIMQEQEKLKARKKRHKNEPHRQVSQPAPNTQAVFQAQMPVLCDRKTARSISAPTDRNNYPQGRYHDDSHSPNSLGQTEEENHYERPFDIIRTPSPQDRSAGSTSPGPVFQSDVPNPHHRLCHKERPHRTRDKEVVQGSAVVDLLPPASHCHNSINPATNTAEGSHTYRPDQSSPVPSSNVFAAVDPTYNRDRDMMDPPNERIHNNQEPPELPQRTPPQQTSPPAVTGDETYYNTGDDEDFNPVPGQKRDTIKRGNKKGSKKGSCKQQ